MSDLKTFVVTYHFAEDRHKTPHHQRVCSTDRESLEKTFEEMFDLEFEIIDSVAEA